MTHVHGECKVTADQWGRPPAPDTMANKRPLAPKLHWEPNYPVVEPLINADGVHVWPFDPAFPVDFRTFVCRGRNPRANRHHYYEILYVYSGESDFHVQDRRLQVREGDLVVIGSELYHRIFTAPHERIRLAALFFEPEIISNVANGEGAEYLLPFSQQGPNFPHVIPSGSPLPGEVFGLMRRIQTELPPESSRGCLAVRTYLKMILMLLVNHYASTPDTRASLHRKQQDLNRLKPLFEHLEHNFAHSIRVKDAARICAMSTSHFMYFFKQVTGQSFLSFLNHFRIAKAQAELISTDQPVCQISQNVGFCDQSHLSLVFRRFVGVTPLAYRKRFSCQNQLGNSSERTLDLLHPTAAESAMEPRYVQLLEPDPKDKFLASSRQTGGNRAAPLPR